MRPIDADALMQRIENWDRQLRSFTHYTDRIACDVLCGVVDEIEDIDTLDYAPVRHGEFERLPEECIPNFRFTPVFCKTCNTTFATINKEAKRCTCCPYCGAKMDGGKDDG